ncbi:MAG: diphosphomevalonate decarboxylase [Candidatus Thermoplasmatota archaeon]|nr:diphosphomevalonate decarboxylase [Candidatus Thermoplasmatota archaeon]
MGTDGIPLTRARAYPTIGVILLGGLTDNQRRYPRHTSAGIAYTDGEGSMFAEVEISASSTKSGSINGTAVTGDEPRSPFPILYRYRERILGRCKINDLGELSFESWSRNIPSGSSDAAAAAFGASIESILGNGFDDREVENEFRTISESVGRSMKGGLTLTHGEPDPWTEKLLGEESFDDYRIMAYRFPDVRKPSDTIHENITSSPEYQDRIEETERKGKELRSLAESLDIEGIFDLAEKDTDRYHRLIESVGVRVITPGMDRMLRSLRESRTDFWNRYIVTGGSNVFAAVRKEDTLLAEKCASGAECTVSTLKVAGKPIIENMLPKKNY